MPVSHRQSSHNSERRIYFVVPPYPDGLLSSVRCEEAGVFQSACVVELRGTVDVLFRWRRRRVKKAATRVMSLSSAKFFALRRRSISRPNAGGAPSSEAHYLPETPSALSLFFIEEEISAHCENYCTDGRHSGTGFGVYVCMKKRIRKK